MLYHILLLSDPMGCNPPGSSAHGFLQQEYWSGLPCPPPGDLPNSGTKPMSPVFLHLQADSVPPTHLGHPMYHLYREPKKYSKLVNITPKKSDSQI